MADLHVLNTRRQFIFGLGTTAALLSMPRIAFALANQDAVLPFRRGAAPLLLHFNENSLGMSPLAIKAANLATSESGNRYPDASVENFRVLLADKHQVKPDQIIFGNGSTEVIKGVVTYAARQQATAIEPTPTFGDVRRYSKAQNMEVIQVPVGNGFVTDLNAIKQRCDRLKGPLLINICNPNNPTGTSVDQSFLEDWISKAPENHIFLIDEAYYEYAQANPSYRSALALIQKGRENLIITRTFSKVYGMAGMRVGYGIATSATAANIRPFAAGFNLTTAGLAAASAALSDNDFFQKSIQSNQQAKMILTSALDELDLDYIPSDTNFLLHKIGAPLGEYSQHMKQNGILVGRKMTADDNWNRISLGTPEEMRQFIEVLKVFRGNNWV